MSRRGTARPTNDEIGRNIRSELRRIINKRDDLRKPLAEFFELNNRPADRPRFQLLINWRLPAWSGEGLLVRVKTISIPEERLEDKVFDFARAVWHLRDRLNQWQKGELKSDVECTVLNSRNLKICADLINDKKHARHGNSSGLNPRLSTVNFDTSTSGLVEFQYNGGVKESMLLVSDPNPIRYWIDIHSVVGNGVVSAPPDGPYHGIGDAAEIIWSGFKDWLPLLSKSGVLAEQCDDADAERRDLTELLSKMTRAE